MLFKLVLFIIIISSNAFSQPILQAKFEQERKILNGLIGFSGAMVNGDACNSKKMIVGDFISQYLLLASQPDTSGRIKKLEFHCDLSSKKDMKKADPQNCKLTFGEKIQLPNEPEGWSRTLQFTFDLKTNSIDRKSFRCLDIP